MTDYKRERAIFEITAHVPAAWLEHANTLRIASSPIWEKFVAIRDNPYLDDSRLKNLAYFRGYMLLSGLAVENLLKALAVKRGLITSRDGKLKFETPLKPRDGHALTKIADTLNIDLTSDEREILRRLQECVSWAARYPVHLNASADKKARDEKKLALHPTDPGVIEGLFKKVSELIEVNLTI